MITGLFARWADAKLRQEVADLESEVDALRRKLAVAEAETESMAAVIARDRARVEAETAVHNRRRADAEGIQHERSEQSLRDFAA